MSALERLAGGLIVSCQAPAGSPFRDPFVMTRVAQSAIQGGAAGLRVNGPEDIAAIRPHTDRPIIGLHKTPGKNRNMITTTIEAAAGLIEAGADLVAIDATTEALGDSFAFLSKVRLELGCSVMADVSTVNEGMSAWDQGVDVVGTTLSGYTPDTQPSAEDPDLELVYALAKRGVRVIAEGRYRTPSQLKDAFDAGAYAVVVGGAITDPLANTVRFAALAPRAALTTRTIL